MQRLLEECRKSWDIDLYTRSVPPERMKYASFSLTVSALMQTFNNPERIKGEN